MARTHNNVSFTEMCNPLSGQAQPLSLPATSIVVSEITAEPNRSGAHVSGSGQRFTPPLVHVHLLTTVIPTAYYQQLTVEQFPLVTVHLDNTGPACDDVTVSIRVFIEDYSDTAVRNIAIARGEQKKVALLPVLRPEAIGRLNEIRRATLHTIIHQTTPTKQELPGSGTEQVDLHARNTALLAEKKGGIVVDLMRYLAAWVTPRHASIDALLRQAHLYNANAGYDGYDGDVEEQVRAIYTTLKEDIQLIYSDSYHSIGAGPHQHMQKVRLPSESLDARMANCLDGAVLFASLLESIAIEPVLLMVPDHAIVGWRSPAESEQINFLDIAQISKADFAEARRQGDLIFQTYKTSLDKELFVEEGFARLIDIADCREQGIYPLQ
jgi:hypothetical protein